MSLEIIYCADGNKRFAEIAIAAGFTYGAQVPNTVYPNPEFTDQKWRKPNLNRYVESVSEFKPRLATVLDWERWEQLDEVFEWAEAIAPYVSEAIIIIPKVIGGIAHLPEFVNGKPIRLGYSVPSSFGTTLVSPNEFLGWPVHLLGGSPEKQASLAGLYSRGRKQLFWDNLPRLNVVSVDCNYHHLMATRYNQFFIPQPNWRYENKHWPRLWEADGKKWGDGSKKADAPYEAFKRSCEGIMEMWRGENGHHRQF